MSYDNRFHEKAIVLRKKGFYILEISKILGIAKSTISMWLRNIELDVPAQNKLKQRHLLSYYKASQRWKKKKTQLIELQNDNALKTLKMIPQTPELYKLLSSFLFWTEGGRATDSLLYFINSDPQMVITFVKLLRECFVLDESKFRALVHVHEYHNESLIKKYWSDLTGIPLSQFSKSYLKPHTKKRIREGYMGSIRIRYYDYKIALELRSVYNMFAKQLLGV